MSNAYLVLVLFQNSILEYPLQILVYSVYMYDYLHILSNIFYIF